MNVGESGDADVIAREAKLCTAGVLRTSTNVRR